MAMSYDQWQEAPASLIKKITARRFRKIGFWWIIVSLWPLNFPDLVWWSSMADDKVSRTSFLSHRAFANSKGRSCGIYASVSSRRVGGPNVPSTEEISSGLLCGSIWDHYTQFYCNRSIWMVGLFETTYVNDWTAGEALQASLNSHRSPLLRAAAVLPMLSTKRLLSGDIWK